MDDERLITDLFEVYFDEEEIMARPYEFNDPDNPTIVHKSHTTCPKCGNRVVMDHIDGDHYVEVDDKIFTYCDNCDNGRDKFENLMFPVQFYDVEAMVSPKEYNGGKVVSSVAVCPECGEEVTLTDKNMISLDGITYTHCDNCGFGKEQFDLIADLDDGSAELPVDEDTPIFAERSEKSSEFKYDFNRVFDSEYINRFKTANLNGIKGFKPDDEEEETVDDLVNSIVIIRDE